MAPTINGLGKVQSHVKTAAEEIASRFGIHNIYGFATSGHMAGSDHYTGLALDVMIGSSGKGNLIAEWAVANAQRLGVKYVIWSRKIHNLNDKGWTAYSGNSPHTDHVHISFSGTPGSGPNVDTGSGSTDTDVRGCLGALAEAFGITL